MAGPDVVLRRTTGVVEAFDEEGGWGTVRDASGESLLLHCTAIADGSRRIEVGAHVALLVVAGRFGRPEAAEVRPLDPAPSHTGSQRV